MTENYSNLKFTGSQINYYFICKRKLWFFSHNIELESESDLVKLGKLLHENRYRRKLKEVQIDRIKLDFVERDMVSVEGMNLGKDVFTSVDQDVLSTTTSFSSSEIPRSYEVHCERPCNSDMEGGSSASGMSRSLVIHEVKRSKRMQDAHLYQLLYYMYYLKTNYDVKVSHGVLHYPLLKQNVDVYLTEDRIKQIEEVMYGITEVNSQPNPPEAVWKRYCRSCAYQDLCWG